MKCELTPGITIDDTDLSERFVRASGPGGQNVNKLSTAVELRFNMAACESLTEPVKARLAKLAGRRLTLDGVIVIFADRFRTQERNRADARERLGQMIAEALISPKSRRPTRPTLGSKMRRLEGKTRRSEVKKLRGGRPDHD
jgi:ribosome-associated protein